MIRVNATGCSPREFEALAQECRPRPSTYDYGTQSIMDHSDTSHRRVALVDDDEAVRDALGLMLRIAGHDVVTFPSASSLLAVWPVGVNCLILDHHMPLMTGLELAAELRNRGDSIRILLITGAPSPRIIRLAKDLRVEKVLEKPPSEEDLLQFIDAR